MKKHRLFSRFILFIPLFVTSCIIDGDFDNCKESVYGDGNVTEEVRSLEPFHKIEINIAGKIYLRQGDKQEFRLVTDDNLHEVIQTKVMGERLIITSKANIRKNKTTKIYITTRQISKLEISGAVKLYTQTPLESDELDLEVGGASDLEMEIVTGHLSMDLSGAAKISLSGEARLAEMNVSGATDIEAFDLRCEEVSIDFSGFGKAEIYVTESLDVNLSGLGKVVYKGNPSVTSQISGLGSVTQRND